MVTGHRFHGDPGYRGMIAEASGTAEADPGARTVAFIQLYTPASFAPGWRHVYPTIALRHGIGS